MRLGGVRQCYRSENGCLIVNYPLQGRVPTNDFGRVDLFHPRMLPGGCVHLKRMSLIIKELDRAMHAGLILQPDGPVQSRSAKGRNGGSEAGYSLRNRSRM
jgi:hypothetical protein